MKRVKLIHEDLNAGGGAERLAAASLETLKELDFSVDLVTFTKPNWNELERIFGISKLRNFVNNVIKADINSLLGDDSSVQSDNNEYDIIMNAHGDTFHRICLLPVDKCLSHIVITHLFQN